ncbi:MAG: sulfotransferase [Verrucomicrobiae bacterium]|nr:sulfotransferase [Verrucomicrobiae bacterium]
MPDATVPAAPLQVASPFLCLGVPLSELPRLPLPDFLVIGAMKCGTTTLYHDLRRQPGVALPDKESNGLLQSDPAAAYRRWFGQSGETFLRGEVCPDYTKPGLDRRAALAARGLYGSGPKPKLVYLVRDPIARLLSHHYFVSTQHGEANPGGMTSDLDSSLRDFPELIDTSRYACRLAPWVEAFGKESLKVVRFEDYVSDRRPTISDVAGFIGLETADLASIDPGRVDNPSATRPVATPGWRCVLGSPLYRRWVRPLLSADTREGLRRRLLPKPPSRPAAPSEATLARLVETLTPEVEALRRLLGSAEPWWDLDQAWRSGAYSSAPAVT